MWYNYVVTCSWGDIMISKIAELLKNSKTAYALTGAGVSTESGIPDYRSKETGLWEKINPMQAASVDYLISEPAKFYNLNIPRWSAYTDSKPNMTHIVLAELEKAGYIKGVITQNIDGLHYKAGSKNLREVHGHLRTVHCMNCNKTYDFSEMHNQYLSGANPPKCRCGGILRPDVVLFGDPMSSDYYSALRDVQNCDLMLVVGSSLQVYPVAELPLFAKRLVIINREPTPFDDRAEVVIHDSAGKVSEKLYEQLLPHL
jgi:NAD-dependent deacetylase